MYYNPTLERKDLIYHLKTLDEEIYDMMITKSGSAYPISITIAGSSSLILNNIHINRTEDIDVLDISHQIDFELLSYHNMNTRIKAMEHCLPYYCLDRTIDFELDTKVIQYKLLTIEDAVIGKISAYREKDKNHLLADNLIQKKRLATIKRVCFRNGIKFS